MIRFLDPAFLLGMLAIAVPVVLHLLFRRRVPVLLFPLARLVQRAERSRQPRKRLNRVLLLVARSLMLAFLALALARTMLGSGSVAAASRPGAVVVVLDDSLSMQAEDARGRTAFDAGKDAADELLRALPEGSLSAVVAASAPDRTEPMGLLTDADATRRALAAITPTLRHATLGPALEAAARLLQSSAPTSGSVDRRVVLVSDLARHAFAGVRLPAATGQRPELVLQPPFPKDDRTNRSVTGVDASILPDGRLGVVTRVAAWGVPAHATGDDAIRLDIKIGPVLGELRPAGRATVSPRGGASAEHRFELVGPEAGYGRVELSVEHDFMPADDVREAALLVAQRARVLVVDGDPQNISFGSETFYLEKALAPGVGLDLDSRIVTLADIGPSDFRTDVVVLCNVPELSVERARALTDAVRAGTGLVVALGNRVDQTIYNGRLADVLPATVTLPRRFDPPAGVDVLDGPALPRVGVTSAMSIEPDAGARILARLSDGTPLLVEAEVGEGRVVLLGTTLDRDWTDLPISPHFLPFLRSLVDRVAARSRGLVLPDFTVGSVADLSAAAAAGATRVQSPSGRIIPLSADGSFAATDEPGVHAALADAAPGQAAGHGIVAAFAVVTDPAESDLVRNSPEEIAAIVGPAFAVGGTAAAEASPSGGWAAWKSLLVALVVLVGIESFIARRAA